MAGDNSALIHCPTKSQSRRVAVTLAVWFPDLSVVLVNSDVTASEQRARLAQWSDGRCLLVGTSTVTAGLDLPSCSLVIGLYAYYSMDQLLQTQARCGRNNAQSHRAFFLFVPSVQKQIEESEAAGRDLGDLTQDVIDRHQEGSYDQARAKLLYRPHGVRAAAIDCFDAAGITVDDDQEAQSLSVLFQPTVCRRRLFWFLLDEQEGRPEESWFEQWVDCAARAVEQLECDHCVVDQVVLRQDCESVEQYGLLDDPDMEPSTSNDHGDASDDGPGQPNQSAAAPHGELVSSARY